MFNFPFCPICAVEPNSHSFHVIPSQNINVRLFYSCPAKATKYFEPDGVINHFDFVLKQNHHFPWAWVFDCDGFTLAHASQVKTSISIADLISNKYGENLKKVWIINPTWSINLVLKVMWPILPNRLRNVIEKTDKTLEEIQQMPLF